MSRVTSATELESVLAATATAAGPFVGSAPADRAERLAAPAHLAY
ncbi:hypothetical protein [Amycolatopsis circi]|nr:hypothetical protein [Amycolatopsis circi]